MPSIFKRVAKRIAQASGDSDGNDTESASQEGEDAQSEEASSSPYGERARSGQAGANSDAYKIVPEEGIDEDEESEEPYSGSGGPRMAKTIAQKVIRKLACGY